MNSVLQTSRFLLLFSILLSFSHAAPETTSAGQPAGTIVVPNGVKVQDVQQAILLAGSGRGWAVKAKEDNKVVLFLEQGGWRSTLTLTFDAKEIQIMSDSGKPDRKGVIKKPAIPESWVKFLKQDITKHLGTKAFGS